MDIQNHVITRDQFERAQGTDCREFAFVNLPHTPHRAIDAWSHASDNKEIDGGVYFHVFHSDHTKIEVYDVGEVYSAPRETVAFYKAVGSEEARALLVALVLHYAAHAQNDV